jgi:hypothetical protein
MNINYFVFCDQLFFQTHNFLEKKEIDKLLCDSDVELKTNYYPSVPLYQTYDNMHERYDWKCLIDKVTDIINSIFNTKNSEVISCWVNLSVPESKYTVHNHEEADVTCVYYLKNPSKVYGTYVKINESEIIICAEENSILIFDSKILHSIFSPPPQISSTYPRYSIAINYKIKQS